VYENKDTEEKTERHKEEEITDISGNDVTVNFITHTADDAFSVTVITVTRGMMVGQVGQQIFLQSVHYCLLDPPSHVFSAKRGLLPKGGGEVAGT
jgi:hypothetical protein